MGWEKVHSWYAAQGICVASNDATLPRFVDCQSESKQNSFSLNLQRLSGVERLCRDQHTRLVESLPTATARQDLGPTLVSTLILLTCGSGGCQASWLVQHLLSQLHSVGTSRAGFCINYLSSNSIHREFDSLTTTFPHIPHHISYSYKNINISTFRIQLTLDYQANIFPSANT